MVGWEASHSKPRAKLRWPSLLTESVFVRNPALAWLEMRRPPAAAHPQSRVYYRCLPTSLYGPGSSSRGATISRNRTRDRSLGRILGVDVDRISCREASELIGDWAALRSSRMVLAANVHMTVEAVDDQAFRKIMNEADLVVADGQPLVWALKGRGFTDVHHVRGQDLVLAVCETAEERLLKVGMYGTTEGALEAAERNLLKRFPRLSVVFSYAPPFRPLDVQENRRIVDSINSSGAQVLFVAIGCPKQEKWMAAHMSSVRAVMIGVGAAIDMIGERQPVAPLWMQSSGLEWVFRLASDPARLWRRYARHNLRFIALIAMEKATTIFGTRIARSSKARG